MSPEIFDAGERLNQLLSQAGMEPLRAETAERFAAYLALLLHWNARTNLTAVRDPEAILSRHFVESMACARALPADLATLLDFGSGAGFPGIPIALCRPGLAVTLAESQGKKAAFLREAARVLELPLAVHAGRAEELAAEFDCVALRAVDKMAAAVAVAARLVGAGGWLALLITREQIPELQASAGAGFAWSEPVELPGAEQRVLLLGQRQP